MLRHRCTNFLLTCCGCQLSNEPILPLSSNSLPLYPIHAWVVLFEGVHVVDSDGPYGLTCPAHFSGSLCFSLDFEKNVNQYMMGAI